MKKSKKLIFFGNERLATAVSTDIPVLKTLIENGYEITTVVSNYTPGRSRNSRELEIAEVTGTHNIPLLLPEKLTEIKDQLQALGAEAAVLVAYGRIVPTDIIDIFPHGIINIHPSLLPKYRGPTPIEQAILDGVSKTGVSLMKLAAKMDAGPVFAQKTMGLSGKETKQDLADKLLQLGSELLIENLPAILDGSLTPKDQDNAHATYSQLLKRQDGLVNWSLSADKIERQIRAFTGFPKSQAKILGHDVILTKARVAKDKNDGDLVIKCRGSWLEIQELTAPSGRTIAGKDFLHGYKK